MTNHALGVSYSYIWRLCLASRCSAVVIPRTSAISPPSYHYVKMSSAASRALRLATRQRIPTRIPQTNPYFPLLRLTTAKALHSSPIVLTKPRNPEPREHPSHGHKPKPGENVGRKRFGDYDVAGKVFIVTGGAQGLGLTMAEALVEAGGKGTPPSISSRIKMSANTPSLRS